jgi:succinate-semialdehyde dehydrogenase/glutarate-semialdehyde dehydrogenase
MTDTGAIAAGQTYPRPELFVGGEWTPGTSGRSLPVVDPGSGEVIAALPCASPADVDAAAQAAATAFAAWRDTPAMERARVLRAAASMLRSDHETLADIITREAGKPLHESRAEVAIGADTLDWFAAEALRLDGRLMPARIPGTEFRVERLAVGPVAAFCAWNAPLANPARKIAPALASGCTVVLKASEETPAGAVVLARALVAAGLPSGALNLVFGDPTAISEQLIAHPAIRKISFTGSTTVGKRLARAAAVRMKPATMELGGHAPVFVFDDADIDAAAAAAAKAKYRNAGQICFSPSRFFVQEAAFDRFAEAFTDAVQRIKVGYGLDEDTEMGPLAHAQRMRAMERLCADADGAGARCVAGGRARQRPGFYWEPTVYLEAPRTSLLMTSEPFGPIAAIGRFSGIDDAIVEANRLPYGLSAYVFTRARDTAATLVEAIESGTIGVNTFQVVLPETPFGGVRDSGIGREGGPEGIEPYTVTRFTHWA